MKKGFSILVALALTAGLCSCGAAARQAAPGDHAVSQMTAFHRAPLCHPWTRCMV